MRLFGQGPQESKKTKILDSADHGQIFAVSPHYISSQKQFFYSDSFKPSENPIILVSYQTKLFINHF